MKDLLHKHGWTHHTNATPGHPVFTHPSGMTADTRAEAIEKDKARSRLLSCVTADNRRLNERRGL